MRLFWGPAYDVFAFEPRNQGESGQDLKYEALHWATDRDLADMRTALDYLTGRPDADPRGVGFFGVSKGGTVGLIAATTDPRVRCCVTDGAFDTRSTLIPFMRKWIRIYNKSYLVHNLMPDWFYATIAQVGIRRVGRERNVRFLSLGRALSRVSPRPLLMIHGGEDTYVKPVVAQQLFNRSPSA